MPLDYSKWKDIEVSDDEDDTHPNVDTPSLFRWRHQARLDRMAENKRRREEIEIQKNDFDKKMGALKKRMNACTVSESEQEKLREEMSEYEKQIAHWNEKEAELAKEEEIEKWNVDTISQEKWTTTRINKASDKPAQPQRSEEEENKLMRKFFDDHENEIKTFSKLPTFAESEKYLVEHPYLCCEWTSNHITLDALNAGITQKEKTLKTIARQVVTLQYLLELATSLKAKPQSPSLIEGFFRKINAAEESYMKLFHSEVEAFIQRVHIRAAQKREEAIKEAEEEERQARIAASPGGLDPIEVMEALPAAMREAFESQEVSRLQEVATQLDRSVFEYHLDRCIKSGLWLPDGGKKNGASDHSESTVEE